MKLLHTYTKVDKSKETVIILEIFIDDDKILQKVVREVDRTSHALVVPQTLTKYILHQVHHALGHNGIMRTYQCLK